MASTVAGVYFGSIYFGTTTTAQSQSSSTSTVWSTANTSTTEVSGAMVSNSTTNLGLKLFASVNTITNGNQILNITFLVQNTLTKVNNVTKGTTWALPLFENKTDTLYQCIGWGNLLVFGGFYSLNNISSAGSSVLPLFQPGVFDNCSYYDFGLYSFQPLSAEAKVYGVDVMSPYGTIKLLGTSQLSGAYVANQTYTRSYTFMRPLPFPPGIYTIAVGDEWGQIALLHFTVEGHVTTVQSIATTMQSASAGSWYYYTTTSAYENVFLSSSRTFAYDKVPSSSFQVGNFTVLEVNNGTGYRTPSGVIMTPFVFAFNATSPNRNTTNVYFVWRPPCSSNLGVPCMQDNSWALPSPENATIHYLVASLLIRFYTNTTGFYVNFQEWDEVTATGVVTVFTSATSNNPGSEVVPSDINSSNACGAYMSYNNGNGNVDFNFKTLLSNVKSNQKFQALEGNRTGYDYGGGGCGTDGLILVFTFEDHLHPFVVFRCGANVTGYPVYQIYVNVFLTPQGYDLSRSNFTSEYLGPNNTPYSCTTMITMSG